MPSTYLISTLTSIPIKYSFTSQPISLSSISHPLTSKIITIHKQSKRRLSSPTVVHTLTSPSFTLHPKELKDTQNIYPLNHLNYINIPISKAYLSTILLSILHITSSKYILNYLHPNLLYLLLTPLKSKSKK